MSTWCLLRPYGFDLLSRALGMLSRSLFSHVCPIGQRFCHLEPRFVPKNTSPFRRRSARSPKCLFEVVTRRGSNSKSFASEPCLGTYKVGSLGIFRWGSAKARLLSSPRRWSNGPPVKDTASYGAQITPVKVDLRHHERGGLLCHQLTHGLFEGLGSFGKNTPSEN